jgi:hypothetical protein
MIPRLGKLRECIYVEIALFELFEGRRHCEIRHSH